MTAVTVIKCGGHAAVDPLAICADVAELSASGPVVLVHGGSAEIDRLGGRLGIAARQLAPAGGAPVRYSDPATLEVVTLALAGAVKPRLVTALASAGVTAVGLTGLDAGLLRARRAAAQRTCVGGRQVVVRDNQGGPVTSVNAGLLRLLLGAGIVPVVSPPALAGDGTVVNTNADRAAAAVAAAVGAAVLLFLTGAPGVLADPGDEDSVLRVCPVPRSGRHPAATAGMVIKLAAARDALAAGVPRVLIADGRRPRPVSLALAGQGTEIILAGPGAPGDGAAAGSPAAGSPAGGRAAR